MLTLNFLLYMMSVTLGKPSNKVEGRKPLTIRKEITMSGNTLDHNTKEMFQKQLQKLREENTALKEQLYERQVFLGKNGNISCRIKGRTPINLYKDQWETVLENASRIKEMLIAHGDKLKNVPEQNEEQQNEAADGSDSYNVA